MKMFMVNDRAVKIKKYGAVIMGSGAAGLCAAKRLNDLGQTDVVILTNGLSMGTSWNTGSEQRRTVFSR